MQQTRAMTKLNAYLQSTFFALLLSALWGFSQAGSNAVFVRTSEPTLTEAGFSIIHNPRLGNCTACHSAADIQGKKSGVQSSFAPALDGVALRYSEEKLRQWVVDARQIHGQTRMPPFGVDLGRGRLLNDTQIDAVVAALKTFRSISPTEYAQTATSSIAKILVKTDTPQSGSAYLSKELQIQQADPSAHPGMLWVAQGRQVFSKECISCHKSPVDLARSVARFPKLSNEGQHLKNLEDQILICQNRLGIKTRLESESVLALSALLHQSAKGQRIAVPAPEVRMNADWQLVLKKGEQLYNSRMGRMNLACLHCHDERLGSQMRGDTVSPAHPTAFPAYRLAWQGLGSLERRLRACYAGVQAAVPEYGSQDLRQLELYLKHRANGMELEGVGLRR